MKLGIALHQLEVKIVSAGAAIQNTPEVIARLAAKGAVVCGQGVTIATVAGEK